MSSVALSPTQSELDSQRLGHIEYNLSEITSQVYDTDMDQDTRLIEEGSRVGRFQENFSDNILSFVEYAAEMTAILGKLRKDPSSSEGLREARKDKAAVMEKASNALMILLTQDPYGTSWEHSKIRTPKDLSNSPPTINHSTFLRTIWLPKDQEKELENICKEIDDNQAKLKTTVNLRVVGCEQEIAMLEEKVSVLSEKRKKLLLLNRGYKAVHQMLKHRLKAAKQAVLGSDALPELTDLQVESVRGKYPSPLENGPSIAEYADFELTPDGIEYAFSLLEKLKPEKLQSRILSRNTNGKKGGNSCMSPRALSVLVRARVYNEAIFAIHQLLALGWFNSDASKMIRTGRGIPLGKNFDDNGIPQDVRPICATEVLLSNTDGVLFKLFSDKFNELAGPTQLGLIPSGCQALATLVQSRHDMHQEGTLGYEGSLFGVAEIDICNAFNCPFREFILQFIRNNIPELLPFYFFMYSSSYTVKYGDKSVESHTGVGQGSPSSAGFFDALMGVWLAAWIEECRRHGVEVFQCHDGTFLIGDIEKIGTLTQNLMDNSKLDSYDERLKKGSMPPGCTSQPRKSDLLIFPSSYPEASVNLLIKSKGKYFLENKWKIHKSSDGGGVMVAGIPVGSDAFIKNSLFDACASCCDDFKSTWENLCGAKAPIDALNVSKKCILPSLSYLLSALPCSMYESIYAICQNFITNIMFVELMKGIKAEWLPQKWDDLPESDKERFKAKCSLRECNGGLGLALFTFTAPAGNIGVSQHSFFNKEIYPPFKGNRKG